MSRLPPSGPRELAVRPSPHDTLGTACGICLAQPGMYCAIDGMAIDGWFHMAREAAAVGLTRQEFMKRLAEAARLDAIGVANERM